MEAIQTIEANGNDDASWMTTNARNKDLSRRLSSLLLSSGWVSNEVESRCVSDAIVSEVQEDYSANNGHQSIEASISRERTEQPSSLILIWKSVLKEYLEVTDDQAHDVLVKLGVIVNIKDDEGQQRLERQHENIETTTINDNFNIDEYDDDDEEVGEGECELCDRYLRLTRHHLIPKSTWPRILPLLQRATEALVQDEKDVGVAVPQQQRRAKILLGPGLEHLIPRLLEQHTQNQNNTTTRSLRWIVSHQTCLICAPCHRAVHKAHDNMTLARDYNTIDQLLQDENVYKFCKWASQQKPGRYAIRCAGK